MTKVKNKNGFTLVEMLACVITLLLIGMLCMTGMNLAVSSYQHSIFETDSQMLESTLNMYIGDILRHATDIQLEDESEQDEISKEKTVKAFTNAAYRIYDGRIEVQERTEEGGGRFLIYESKSGDGNLIVGMDVYAKSLYIESFELIYNTDTGIFTGNYIIRSTVIDDVSRKCEFAFRTIADY